MLGQAPFPLPPGEPVLAHQLERLADPAGDEVARGDECDPALEVPALPSAPVAGRVEPGVVGDRLVLDFLGRVPPPQVRRLAGGAGHVLRIGQRLARHQGGDVLERHCRGEIDDRRALAGEIEPRLDPRLDRGDVVARAGRRPVESDVLARVVRFLPHECADLGLELGRRAFAVRLDRFDEQRFPAGEGDRQRIVPRGRHRIAFQPPARRLLVAAEPEIAHRQREIGRGRRRLVERYGAV